MRTFSASVFVCVNFATLSFANPANRSYGTFQEPGARSRPRFRYWLPDASVDPATLQADIKAAGDIGIGGVELLPFYNYGGGTPIIDWSKYGFGTPPFRTLFRAALEAHRDSGLLMDFAMGPNQGQGVPAETNNEGLQWDLVTSTVRVPADGIFNETVPGWGTGELVAIVSAHVLSETTVISPAKDDQDPLTNYTKLVLKHETLTDITNLTSNVTGLLFNQFVPADSTGSYWIFAFYQKLTHAKNLDPQKNITTNIFDGGCYIVDHFDRRGAQVMTNFWEQHILTNGVKELLTEVGNSGWQDSMELPSNVSWTPSLPARFKKRWGYGIERYLPLIIFGNNNINMNIPGSAPGPLQCVLDTQDEGSGYVNDYRVALAEGYQEYLNDLTNWTKSYLNLQYSSQTSYNFPMDMEASIPYDDVPECESLEFRDNVDSYRQFTGVAYLAQKNVVSIELGAVFGDAFSFTMPRLLFAMNRATSGGVNQFIIHGQAYTGNYTATTWPGYVTFGYRVSDQYSEKRPDWNNGLAQALRYIGRVMYVQQQGVGRIDVAMYNRQSATDPMLQTLYQSADLQSEGWSYAYLSPEDFNLSQTRVQDGVLAPNGPAFKAIIIESTQNMTLDAIGRLSNYTSSGIPIILSGGTPGYYASGDLSGEAAVQNALSNLMANKNVYNVATGKVASQLRSLGLTPNVGIDTNGTWFATWREDTGTGISYAYIFSDTNATSGEVKVSSTKKPFLFNAWTGVIKPILFYRLSGNATIIPLVLGGNQTAIIAFTDQAPDGCEGAPPINIVDLTSDVLGYNYSNSSGISLHVPASSPPGTATLSTGTQVFLDTSDIPKAIQLTNWTLTAEHWKAPGNLNDATVVADKHNTTHNFDFLVSWLDVPILANASGLGFYSTEFSWPPRSSVEQSSLGAYISFSNILNAITVYMNGERLSPLDYSNAVADISAYLRPGSNEVLAIVPTTMWNYIRSILPELLNAGAAPNFPGGPDGSASGPTDNGLVGTASIIPFKSIDIS